MADIPAPRTTERLIGLIIRDVCEISRDPLPDQNPDHVLISVDELWAILEERLTALLGTIDRLREALEDATHG